MRSRVLTAALVLGLCAACGSAAPRDIPYTPPEAPSERDLAYMAAYREIIGATANSVWPGWEVPPPLLQRGETMEYLVGHPDPPADFESLGLTVDGEPVLAAPLGTISPGPYATTWQVGGVWSAMVPIRSVFERTVADVLGAGVVTWDDAAYLRVLLHEGFHAHQFATRPVPPTFGDADDDAARALTAAPGWEDAYADEAAALRDAIDATDVDGVLSGTRQFLELRRSRRAGLGDGAAVLERTQEWTEGAARYADLTILAGAATTGAVPTGMSVPDAATIRRAYLDDLVSTESRLDGLAGWMQALGSAQCQVLDRLVPDWQHGVLVEGRALEDLLSEAVTAA